jgi:hypothetical protein
VHSQAFSEMCECCKCRGEWQRRGNAPVTPSIGVTVLGRGLNACSGAFGPITDSDLEPAQAILLHVNVTTQACTRGASEDVGRPPGAAARGGRVVEFGVLGRLTVR